MANPLLLRAAPELLARKHQVIDSTEKLATFTRLAAIVDEDLGAAASAAEQAEYRARPVSVTLEFGWADSQETLPRVSGRAGTTLPATCQRCLGRCELDVSADIDLLLVDSRDTRSVDNALEVWELGDGRVRPLDVAEEMLIMELPLAAMHADPQDCGESVVTGNALAGETVRPFADLKTKLGRSG